MCLAHSKHSMNITFQACFTYSSPPAKLNALLFLSCVFPRAVHTLCCPNTTAPIPLHPSTPYWKAVPVAPRWKYLSNLYVPFFWLLTVSLLYHCYWWVLIGFPWIPWGAGSPVSLFVVSKLLIIAPWLNAFPVNKWQRNTIREAHYMY